MRQLTDSLASSARLLALAPADVVGLTVDYSNLAFAGEDLARYETPSRFEFVAELPKTTVGKILRRELVRMEMESQD